MASHRLLLQISRCKLRTCRVPTMAAKSQLRAVKANRKRLKTLMRTKNFSHLTTDVNIICAPACYNAPILSVRENSTSADSATMRFTSRTRWIRRKIIDSKDTKLRMWSVSAARLPNRNLRRASSATKIFRSISARFAPSTMTRARRRRFSTAISAESVGLAGVKTSTIVTIAIAVLASSWRTIISVWISASSKIALSA